MGIITLALLLLLETVFLVWSISTKNSHKEELSIIRIGCLIVFVLLILSGIYEWSFRYVAIVLVFIIQAILSTVYLIKKKECPYRLRRTILRFIGNCVIFTFALFLAIVFPQYKQPLTSGKYDIESTKYTWEDMNRLDPYSETDSNRSLTVEFWYPTNTGESYPLIVFSHGAFGFSGSNYSTFVELASNGYVVASIGHTHQAFYTMDTNKTLTLVDQDFLNRAVEITNDTDISHKEAIFSTTKEWLKLRTLDENFVLDKIILESKNKSDPLFSKIDLTRIGLMGHSLGGASSAQVARERSDIDSVIVLDGTMLGEEIGFENNSIVLNEKPYPVPLFNIYAEDHYTNAKRSDGDSYANFYASKHAINAIETVFHQSGHLNFTDLPLFSPPLSKLLGIGSIDARFCIETMNELVLNYFNYTLKNYGDLNIEKEY